MFVERGFTEWRHSWIFPLKFILPFIEVLRSDPGAQWSCTYLPSLFLKDGHFLWICLTKGTISVIRHEFGISLEARMSSHEVFPNTSEDVWRRSDNIFQCFLKLFFLITVFPYKWVNSDSTNILQHCLRIFLTFKKYYFLLGTVIHSQTLFLDQGTLFVPQLRLGISCQSICLLLGSINNDRTGSPAPWSKTLGAEWG